MSIAFRFRAYRRPGGSSALALPGVVGAFDSELSRPSYVERRHGAAVPVLLDLTNHSEAVQSSIGQQPTIDLTSCPGRAAIAFDSGQRMRIPEPSERVRVVYAAVLVPASATERQVLLTQDTSATTDEPAWEVQLG